MALHLGSSAPLQIFTGGMGACKFIIPTAKPAVNGVMLLSADDYILTDSNGIYLTAKEAE